MEPLQRDTSAVDALVPSAVPGHAPHRAQNVAIIFKERRYDTGRPKTWFFTNIDHVTIVQGRVHLLRDGYGLVFDVSAEEVEQVCTVDERGAMQAAHMSVEAQGVRAMASTRILVVEDERIVAQDLQRRLDRWGYTVCATAASGQQAIEQAAQTRPDLVLMDIVLQGPMDGVEAAGQIRARDPLPIIYLTAHADADTLQRAKATEPYGYLPKPFEARSLQTTIETALYKHRMEQERAALRHRLQEALATLTTLRGLLPICAACKKIRDDQGYWKQVEAYLSEHSEAQFTHELCPACAHQLAP